MKTHHTDILILGGGIGGYETFRSLTKKFLQQKIKKKITLIDKNEYFAFIPLLHEVAAGTISPSHTTIHLPDLVQGTPHAFVQTTVLFIDPEKRRVTTQDGIFSYDFCVVALGNAVNYFGIEGAEAYALPIRTYAHALTLRKKLPEVLSESLHKPTTINVIGGGFTGIEIAGQIHDLIREYQRQHHPPHKLHLTIIEGAKTILGPLPAKVQRVIGRILARSGVEIHTGKLVARVNPDSVVLEDGTTIPSSLTIWSGGIKNMAEPLLPVGYTENGRIPVSPYLTHPKAPSLYAVGDIALVKKKNGEIVPPLGEAAHREGEYVAKHLVATLHKKSLRSFSFVSKGALIPVGSHFGAAMIGPMTFFGTLPWYLRRAVYLLFVPGIKNKLHIIIDWLLHRAP